ncbi:hypothetical protein F5Y11DRAFT_347597 [Daldinia sp. FL1419]|nr:hypothetical protein F5Y11DRAFT_347597 [Daldinia sp. FL1419]
MAGPQNPIVIGDDSNDQDARQDAPQKVSPDVIEIEDDQDRPVMPGQWNFDDVEEIEQFPEDLEAPASVSTQEVCKAHVKSVFPNISLVYLDQVTAENNYNSDAAIGAILDHQEKGETYPLEPRDLKRKRKEDGGAGSEDDDEVDEGDEGAKVDSRTIRATRKKVDDFNYRLHTIKKASYADMAKNLLASELPESTCTDNKEPVA